MVTAEQEKQIEELWLKQYSQRAIARQIGVSRDVVRRVVNRLSGTLDKPRQASRSLLGSMDLPEPVIRRFSQRQGICPKCHSLVHLPCLACQVRAWLRIKTVWQGPNIEPRQVHGVGRLPRACPPGRSISARELR